MSTSALPPAVAALATALWELPGVVAVVLGGSRATGAHRPDSDWDLGLYYRGSEGVFDPAALRGLGHDGHVSALGEWGPVVHGGAWLTVDGTPVDVLFRDLETVERWLGEAREGRFEVLTQNGYLVGAPTYLPVGELAICRPIAGALPRPGFPEVLAASADAWWSGRSGVALMFARTYAASGDAALCTGMLVDAALCAGHARLARRGAWVLNEKRLLRRAGLEEVERLLSAAAVAETGLETTVAAVAAALEAVPPSAR